MMFSVLFSLDPMSMEYSRGLNSNLLVLPEGDWRFSEEEGDTIPLSPKIQSSDWCNKCIQLGPTNQRLGFWGILEYNGLLTH